MIGEQDFLIYLKSRFEKFNFQILEDASEGRGVDFFVQSPSGQRFQIDLRSLDLQSTHRSIKVSKSDWNYKLPDNLFVALVLYIQDQEPFVYLIPSKVFLEPDEYIFFDNDTGKGFEHLGNWEIKVFTKGIEKLSEFALPTVLKELG